MGELRLEYYKASGAGGQHRNKVESGCRVIHVPTGLIVTNADERSKEQNKKKALKVMEQRLGELLKDEHAEQVNQVRNESMSENRSYTWTDWRDEVKSSSGKKTSMKRALKGDLGKLLR